MDGGMLLLYHPLLSCTAITKRCTKYNQVILITTTSVETLRLFFMCWLSGVTLSNILCNCYYNVATKLR